MTRIHFGIRKQQWKQYLAKADKTGFVKMLPADVQTDLALIRDYYLTDLSFEAVANKYGYASKQSLINAIMNINKKYNKL